MRSKLIARTALASVAIGALFGSAQLMAEDCVSVKGKILNSSHNPALGSVYVEALDTNIGGVSTIGVVALKGGKPIGKLKCALVGVATGAGAGGLPDFTHTISCDDSLDDDSGIVHSQLTFTTTGYITGSDGCTVFFTENSIPVPGSGKGAFDGVEYGRLNIEGTANVCPPDVNDNNSIDMKFTGEVCY